MVGGGDQFWPEEIEQSSHLQKIHSAVLPVCIGEHPRGQFPHVDRPDRSIPPRAYLVIPPAVPVVSLCGPALSIKGPTIRPILNTQDFHQVAGGAGGTPPGASCVCPMLPEQYTDSVLLLPPGEGGSASHDPGPPGSQIFHQFRQEPTDSDQLIAPPGSSHTYNVVQGLSY